MKKLNVLFLCTGNSARSQMAEALLRRHAGQQFDAYSAGTDPKGINPLTLQVLQEMGIEGGELRSKGVQEYLGTLPVRYLVIVCAEADEKCPTTWPGVLDRLFWSFEDPAQATGNEAERLQVFRATRDAIDQRIKAWLAELRESKQLPAAEPGSAGAS